MLITTSLTLSKVFQTPLNAQDNSLRSTNRKERINMEEQNPDETPEEPTTEG
jgi:hypothetical protein